MPKSDLFDNNVERLLPCADVIEFKKIDSFPDKNREFIFHSNRNLLHPQLKDFFNRDFFGFLREYHISYLSLDLGPAAYDNYLVKQKAVPNRPPLSKSGIGEQIETNLAYIRENFSGAIGVENLNYYNTGAYEIVCEPDYIREIVRKYDLVLLFDIAHARISAHNLNVNFEEYVNLLPLERVIQAHLSKMAVDELGEAYDAHENPSKEDLALLELVINKCPNLGYISIEFYKDIDGLERSYEALRKLLMAIGRRK